MHSKDPSVNVLTTRQVSDLIEELAGKRPSSDQIREWCRQGYVAPEELPPIHLEHVRNRQGHYEITEESVRRFIEMRRRRETNLLAFVKWCRQRSAELQTKSSAESTAAPGEPADASDDEPAPESAEDSIATDTEFVGDLKESGARAESTSQMPTTMPDDVSPQPPNIDPESTVEQIAARPIMAEAGEAFAADLLSQLVVEEAGEEIEEDFFSTFVEDDPIELGLTDDGNDVTEREPTDGGAISAITDEDDDLPVVELPEPDPLRPDSPKIEVSPEARPPEPVDDFGSFDEQPSKHMNQERERRGFRSRRAGRSRRASQQTQSNQRDQTAAESHDPTHCVSTKADAFSLGIFESADELQKAISTAKNVADEENTDSDAATIDIDAGDTSDPIAPVTEDFPDTNEPPVNEAVAENEPITATPEHAPKPTPTHPVAPTLSLPPIKPLPPNSPLLPNFGAPRVSSPLRPESRNQKPIAKPPQNQAAKTPPPRRTNAPAAPRANTKHSAQLDQLAAAYAAFASGAAPAVVEPSVEPESRESNNSPRTSSRNPEAPVKPPARRDIAQENRSQDRVTDDYAIAADATIHAHQKLVAPSPPIDIETETRPERIIKPDRSRAAAQVSRYLWLWVTAIAIGWACFGVSFVIKDDFGVIALSSIAVAATGMSGLWWTGK